MKILDISVTNRRNLGERRKSGLSFHKPKPVSTNSIEIFNSFRTAINHRKHAGSIYRKAVGGFETKGKPRYYQDWFE